MSDKDFEMILIKVCWLLQNPINGAAWTEGGVWPILQQVQYMQQIHKSIVGNQVGIN